MRDVAAPGGGVKKYTVPREFSAGTSCEIQLLKGIKIKHLLI